MQRENIWEKIDKIIGCLWNKIKSYNTHETGFPERERREKCSTNYIWRENGEEFFKTGIRYLPIGTIRSEKL